MHIETPQEWVNKTISIYLCIYLYPIFTNPFQSCSYLMSLSIMLLYIQPVVLTTLSSYTFKDASSCLNDLQTVCRGAAKATLQATILRFKRLNCFVPSHTELDLLNNQFDLCVQSEVELGGLSSNNLNTPEPLTSSTNTRSQPDRVS